MVNFPLYQAASMVAVRRGRKLTTEDGPRGEDEFRLAVGDT